MLLLRGIGSGAETRTRTTCVTPDDYRSDGRNLPKEAVRLKWLKQATEAARGHSDEFSDFAVSEDLMARRSIREQRPKLSGAVFDRHD
jgi:hypothetical protein